MKRLGIFERLLGRSQDDEDEELESLDLEEREMIRGIVELPETTAKEIMVPRIDVIFIALDGSQEEILQTVSECGHSRLPVYRETIDNVVGVLYAKDLLQHLGSTSKTLELEKIIRKPYFVPQSKKLDSLLREFKKRKVHLAVVVDEYGGTSGIVSLEDIIEEIVGDIQDEFDNETEDILEIGENVFLCDARVSIDELNKRLGLSLPGEDVDTLGGFVFNLFGKIPENFEKVTHENVTFIVQQMDQHKIATVKLVIMMEGGVTGADE